MVVHDRKSRHGHRFCCVAGVGALAVALVAGGAAGAPGGDSGRIMAPSSLTRATVTPPGQRMALVRAAAREFGVPVDLLLAISYDESRWEGQETLPSGDGGYGLMNLTARTFPADDGRGDTRRPVPRTVTLSKAHHTLNEAADLLGLPVMTLEHSERENIRGAAALLARYARELAGGSLPATLNGWYGAVAAYSGDTTSQLARLFADEVFRTLRRGASLTTMDGQVMYLRPAPGLRPDRAQLGRLGLTPAGFRASATAVDCPAALHCRWVPAAYRQNDPNDPSNYGNYDKAGRPSHMADPAGHRVSMNIKYIIIHDTEGSYHAAISTFQDPASYVSANYVIRSSDGAVTEMVRPHNVSWGAGDWYVNMHAINIENEGFAARGRIWYTPAMYRSCAALVRYLAARYHIPLNRMHILGHEDVPGPTDAWTIRQHWDPGPFWNWNHFMALVHKVSDSAERASGGAAFRGTHRLVTIDPTFATNQPKITDCSGSRCITLQKQPANFVYLHTGPGGSYPLIGDPLLHPGGGHGTTVDSDWGDKATIGEAFAFAGQHGNWTAIWFSGRKAWFYNPRGAHRTALYTSGRVIMPKAGLLSIPVDGAAYPEPSAYPSVMPVTKVVKLAYNIHAGQAYPVIGTPTDYYYAVTINSSRPDDHTVVIGKTRYDQISFNHRRFFVRASNVIFKNLP
jgi:N-acetyl-anhydromuramyl-L-alanine amidase AmpD